jgi:aminoglycoside phosphotransferase (APT) family kinase protein/GNAT superfamily N-acetyltransferase
VGTFTVCPAGPHLPEGLTPLAADAEREGIRNVSALVAHWVEGTTRFDRPGERLLVAVAGGDVVGVGGLTRCPDVDGALRVRRFYVSPAWRRRGVAAALATQLIDHGFAHVELITCNARASAAAGPFWEHLGFEPVPIEGITHVLRRGDGERIHDDEPDTGEATVRALLASELPAIADLPLSYVRSSGTDNAMWRLRRSHGDDLVVRLPRRPHAAEGVDREVALLQALADRWTSAVRIPTVRHVGEPHEAFPHRWSVLDWLDGTDAWTARRSIDDPDALAVELADAVLAIGALRDLPLQVRPPGRRGGPIGPLVRSLERWLDEPRWDAASLVDVAGVRRLAAEALEVADEQVAVGCTHGDLIPGNLLLGDGRLCGVIDWGGAGHGDLAQDLAPAWSVLDAGSRDVFRRSMGVDDAAWIRGRTFELEHAVGGVLYYVPRRHPLGDAMARTLDRILRDP